VSQGNLATARTKRLEHEIVQANQRQQPNQRRRHRWEPQQRCPILFRRHRTFDAILVDAAVCRQTPGEAKCR